LHSIEGFELDRTVQIKTCLRAVLNVSFGQTLACCFCTINQELAVDRTTYTNYDRDQSYERTLSALTHQS